MKGKKQNITMPCQKNRCFDIYHYVTHVQQLIQNGYFLYH